MTSNALPRRRGFTIIEMLVTLAIMSVLASVAVPWLQLSVQRERERELRAALAELRAAIDAYKQAADGGRIELRLGQSGYPPDLERLVEGVVDQRSPSRQRMYFLRRIPRDPFHSDATIDAARTWGLRSYASPPDDPKAGDDVFDVYSTSTRQGLNGVPLRAW